MSPLPDLVLPALLEASWKAALLIGAAALLTWRMRRSTAAARHLVWSSTLAGVLLLPALSVTLPALPVLPRLVELPAPSAPEARSAERAVREPERAPYAVPRAAEASRPEPSVRLDWERWLPLLWALGAAAVLLRLAGGLLGVWWLGRRAVMVTDGGWLHLAHELARRLGLSRGVTLLRGDRDAVPMTWGVLQPVVWLPANAEAWSAERRTVVLAHELAHVRRRDALTQWIAHLALVAHWYNPLVWHAVRRLREERERACDDAVLEVGTLPVAYADHLLDLVRSLGESAGPAAAMAMARRSQFEGRLLAILDGAARRGGIGRGAAAATLALALGAVVPLASLRAGEPAPPASPREAPSAFLATEIGPPAPPAPDTVPSASAARAAPDPVDLVALVAELDSDGAKSSLLAQALRSRHPDPAFRREVVRAARTIRSSGDRSTVLLAALREPTDPQLLREVLAATAGLSSSGDQATVLLRLVRHLPLEEPGTCDALFSVLAEVDSPGDRASVLLALLERRDLPEATLERAIRAAGAVESDGDAATLLVRAAEVHRPRLRGRLRDAFLDAARDIGSDSDRATVLSRLLDSPRAEARKEFSHETVLHGSHDGRASFDLAVNAERVVLTGDGEGVADLLPGGRLTVDHTRYPGNPDPDPLVPAGSQRTVERSLRVRRSGEGLTFEYTVDGERREFGDEGRAWLAQILRRLHRG